MASIRIQKMILFLLQKGTISFNLILGKIFIASMQSAASVRNICKSYIHNVLQLSQHTINEQIKEKICFITAGKHFHIILHRSLFYSARLKV